MKDCQILVPISVGELVDKITILQIKSDRLTSAQKLRNVHHELALLTQVSEAAVAQTPTVERISKQLRAVNEELWRIEDDIRLCERNGDFSDRFVALARAVYVTNDRRAALKRELNLEVGSDLVEEKSYEDYR